MFKYNTPDMFPFMNLTKSYYGTNIFCTNEYNDILNFNLYSTYEQEVESSIIIFCALMTKKNENKKHFLQLQWLKFKAYIGLCFNNDCMRCILICYFFGDFAQPIRLCCTSCVSITTSKVLKVKFAKSNYLLPVIMLGVWLLIFFSLISCF